MNINLIAPINQLGYGITGLNIMCELDKQGHQVSLFPIGNSEVPTDKTDIFKRCRANAEKYDSGAISLRIWHANDLNMHVGYDRHIGFPIFELDNFTEREQHELEALHSICVCSKWAKQVVWRQTKAKAISVVPLGVDTEIFQPAPFQKGATTFFNCGKWEKRKGHDILVDVFNKAFEPTDDVMLYMHCHNPFLSAQDNQAWIDKYMRSKLGRHGKIRVSGSRFATQHNIRELMKRVDCGVFPYRAEGWNMEMLELMAMGRPVIATDYSGPTEYLHGLNSVQLRVSTTEPAIDNIWFRGEGNWAVIDNDMQEHMIQAMRTLHEWKKEGKNLLSDGGIETAKKFTWQHTVQKLVEEIC